MAFLLLRRVHVLRPLMTKATSLVSSQSSKFSTSKSINQELHLWPLFGENYDVKDCKIEVMDDATWRVSSALAEAWRVRDHDHDHDLDHDHDHDGTQALQTQHLHRIDEDMGFDEIEDMRIHGNLFYKLDKEDKKFHFHTSKSTRNNNIKKQTKNNPEGDKILKKNSTFLGFDKENTSLHRPNQTQRTLTFNQMTAPYHEPFCLDIYISKGSVRACVIHRATSKVVSVSHSISKDMKFDLASTKNRTACAAVGRVLAQRALADDIHNVVYTPRKGDKLEGKIGVVVKAIVDSGLHVRVKLKQKISRGAKTHSIGNSRFEK